MLFKERGECATTSILCCARAACANNDFNIMFIVSHPFEKLDYSAVVFCCLPFS